MLSVVIPVYNERNTILKVIQMVKEVPPHDKEVVIVDDGSTDGTREFLLGLHKLGVHLILHDRNRGKGAAVRTGFEHASGDVVVVQDADLEYDPRDWGEMLRLIEEDKADVVFGSRFFGKAHRVLFFHHYMGNRLISFLVNLLYDLNLSDVEVGYKMFRREILKEIKLTQNDFGFEVEFTAKVAKQRFRIYEVGIHYYGRTYAEGKKINVRDGLKALYYIIKYRFWD
jgi:glycosyltransferase involved in cell wall biosynthesis